MSNFKFLAKNWRQAFRKFSDYISTGTFDQIRACVNECGNSYASFLAFIQEGVQAPLFGFSGNITQA